MANAPTGAPVREGRLRAMAAKQTVIRACIASTHQRLVRSTSTSGLHKGLITQGRYSRLVYIARSALLIPILLNIVTETTFTMK